MRPDIVVKLGGSLLPDRQRLARVLKMIADSPMRVLVVPGGGVFADAVRTTQGQYGFSDATAHDMAVLATHQMGLLLHGMQPQLAPVSDTARLSEAFGDGVQAVAMAGGFLGECDGEGLPRSWSATSDAIAAWLAVRLGAPMLTYVKSCAIPAEASLASLRDDGVLDPVCVDVLDGEAVDVQCFGPNDETALRCLLLDVGGVSERSL